MEKNKEEQIKEAEQLAKTLFVNIRLAGKPHD